MKIPKVLTICFVVCCLFTGSVFAVPTNVGVSVSIRAEFQGTDDLAFVAEEGDIIEYYVTVSLSDDQFPIFDGEPSLTLPNGTVVDLDDALSLPTGGSQAYPAVAYTVSAADLGNQPGAEANEVRALADVTAQADTGSTIQDVTASTNFDTVVVNPCVEVEKVASCDIVKEGDTYNYTITIRNCGGDDLVAVSIDDTMFGSLLPACEVLPAGGECIIEIPHIVPPDSPDPIVNEVTVVYAVATATDITVTDTDTEEVDVINPDFTVTKECITDNVAATEVTFLITIDNTGDVPLDFTTDEAEVPPFTLSPGGQPHMVEVTRPVPPDATEVENTINVTASLQPDYICGDNPSTIEKSDGDTCNILTPDFTVTKECITPEVVPGEMATFLITITNTGEVALDFVTDEPEIGPFTLQPGETLIQEVDRIAVEGTVENTINVTATVDGIELTGSDGDTCLVLVPDFEVVKNCLTDPVIPDSNALFEIIVTNTGQIALDFEIDDAPDLPFIVGPIAPGGTWTGTVQRVPGDCGVDVVVSNTVIVTALYGDGQQLPPKEATAECPVPCQGEDGCTPGFWKNHPACWCDSYTPDMLAADVFTALQDPNYADYSDKKCDFDADTLMDAINYGGGRGVEGAARNLLRHSVAAILNGCSTDVAYPISDALIIDLVNAALATEDVDMIQELHSVLAEWNEYGCPINAHCDPEEEPEPEPVD